MDPSHNCSAVPLERYTFIQTVLWFQLISWGGTLVSVIKFMESQVLCSSSASFRLVFIITSLGWVYVSMFIYDFKHNSSWPISSVILFFCFDSMSFPWSHKFEKKRKRYIQYHRSFCFYKSNGMKIYLVVGCGWSVFIFTSIDQKLILELYIKKFCTEISPDGISPSVRFSYKCEHLEELEPTWELLFCSASFRKQSSNLPSLKFKLFSMNWVMEYWGTPLNPAVEAKTFLTDKQKDIPGNKSH